MKKQSLYFKVVARVERRLIRSALRKHNNNVSQTARYLGLNRTGFHHIMNRVGVSTGRAPKRGNWGDLTH